MKKMYYILFMLVLAFSESAFSQKIRLTIESPTIPVLVKKEINPTIKLNFIQHGQRPYTIQKIIVDALKSTDPNDILSVGVYGSSKKGMVDTLQIFNKPQAPKGRIVFTNPINVATDTFSLWIAVKLREKVSLDHKVVIQCKEVITNRGKLTFRSATANINPLRIGVAVRQKGQDGVNTSRIPGIATANDGTLMAIFDARYQSSRDLQGDIDIAMHRSFDKGLTWGPMQKVIDMGTWGDLPQKYNGVSDACILVERSNGDIYVAGLWMHGLLDKQGKWMQGLTESNNEWEHQWRNKGSQRGFGLRETSQFLITKSTDNGATWGYPDNITPKVKKEDWWLLAPAPGQGLCTSDGKLIFPTDGRDSTGMPFSNITYSLDHGRTWKTSNPAYHNATESNAVELTDGSIMLNMRDNTNKGNTQTNGRRISTTDDLGQTWTEHPTSKKALVEPTCMGSLYRHYYTENGERKSILLFVNPSDTSIRDKITLKVSFDDGMSWPEKYWIMLDLFRSPAYSSITSIDEQSVGILFESSQAQLVFLKLSLKEILKR